MTIMIIDVINKDKVVRIHCQGQVPAPKKEKRYYIIATQTVV